jgi:hypothetical protein
MPVSGLDEPCPVFDRPSGDHTLREWAKCMGTTTTSVPFAEVPDDMAAAAATAIREQFAIDDDLILADGVVVRAATLDGHAGVVGIKVPALVHEFQINVPGHPPATIARVLFVGDVDSMRGYGRLVRDSANGAVNAVERSR